MVFNNKGVYNIDMVLRLTYLILFFISFLELVIFYEITSNKINKNYLILYLTTIISNFGYSMATYASSLEAAMCGNLLSYIGSIFTLLFMLIVVVEMCGMRFFMPLRITLLICAVFISVMIATTRDTNIFFSHPYLVQENSFSSVKYTVGPGMIFYMFYLASINLSAILIVTYSIFTKKMVSRKTLQILLCMLVTGTLFYVIPLALGIALNFMPFIYVFMETFFIYVSSRANIYDIPNNLMSVYNSRDGYGYIAFDSKKRFLGCDDFALSVFPDLKTLSIDSPIPYTLPKLMIALRYKNPDWTWEKNCNKDFKISTDEVSLIATIHPIVSKFNRMGYLMELRDDTEQQNYIKGINTYNKELTRLVGEKTRQVTDMQDSIIKGMAIMVESRDNSTGGHILRTSDCIQIFAGHLLEKKTLPQITSNFCKLLIKAAPMHDLGKISVDDSILRKPGKFFPEEYEEMKKHAAEGAKIVKKILRDTPDDDFERIAVNVAHYHHEKWNGEGYPEGLKGEEIPLEARIMALADVFDALVSKRCYKEAKSYDEAFSIIQNDLGKHFDPVIGQAFIECRPLLEAYYNSTVHEI